jgi:hypothetical protein
MSPFIPTVEGLLALALAGPGGWAGINTVQHHDMHHRFPTRHFSLYFTHWDRLCGTLYPGYDEGLFKYFGGSGSGGKGSVTQSGTPRGEGEDGAAAGGRGGGGDAGEAAARTS